MPSRILLVDDSDTVRNVVSKALKSNGYEVLEAIDGVEALNCLNNREDDVDLIVTDINMPNMGGIEFIKAIKADNRFASIPVLTLTSETEESSKEEGRKAGAFAWITKPSTPEKINTVVKLTLSKHKKTV